MIPRSLLLLVFFWSATGQAQTLTTGVPNRIINASARLLVVRVVGRVNRSVGAPVGSNKSTIYSHEWPGIYFETAFKGNRFFLILDDTFNEYRLIIDDRKPLALKPLGHVAIEVKGLGKSVHRVRLEKVTESVGRIGKFGGFYIPPEARASPLHRPNRQLEFVGDSSMTGYGDRASTTQCTAEEARLSTDTQQAYPALLAKALGADYQINAISGRGLIRNYAGSSQGSGMREVYPFVFFDKTEPYSDHSWHPQIIFVRLIADFVSPLRPGEPWTNMSQLSGEYIAAYGNFIRELHERSPAATILIWWPDAAQISDPGFAQMFRAAQKSLEQAAADAGVKHIAFFSPSDVVTDGNACDHHFSISDHRKIAAWIKKYLNEHSIFLGRP